MQPWTRPSGCRGDSRTQREWCGHAESAVRGSRECSQREDTGKRTQESKVERSLSLMKTVQDTTELDISTNKHGCNSWMEKKWGAFCIPPFLLTYLAQSFPSPWFSITWWFVCRERLLTLILLPLKFFILIGVFFMLCLIPTFPQSFSFVCTVTLKTECS